MIKLIVEPRASYGWATFVSPERRLAGFDTAWPAKRIALDGFVSGPPKEDFQSPERFVINFDHHDSVHRMSTRCTSAQVQMALRLGLREHLKGTHVFVNDCDQDTCLAVWLLSNPDRAAKSEPLLNRLIWAEDALDSTGGAYPIDVHSALMRELTWIFEPYQAERWRVQDMNSQEMRSVIEAVCARIDKHLMGKGEEVDPDLRYERIGGGPGWVFVEETGFSARSGMYADGVRAFASAKKDYLGRHHYSVGRMSPYVPFPLSNILFNLNQAEQTQEPPQGHGWGGSDLIAGGPRHGSRLSPGQVEIIINAAIKK